MEDRKFFIWLVILAAVFSGFFVWENKENLSGWLHDSSAEVAVPGDAIPVKQITHRKMG